MSAAELDKKLSEFKTAYTKNLKPDDSGPFRHLVEREKRRVNAGTLDPGFFKRIDQAAYSAANGKQSPVYVSEPGSPERSVTVTTFDDAWQAIRHKYGELERKNALLQQVIREMSRREDYLLENAKLKKQIERMIQERHYLIKTSSELGDALREEKSKSKDILEKSQALSKELANSPVLKDIGVQSPPVSPLKYDLNGRPSPQYREILQTDDIVQRTTPVPSSPPPPPPPQVPAQPTSTSPPYQNEINTAERRAQLRLNISNLRKSLALAK